MTTTEQTPTTGSRMIAAVGHAQRRTAVWLARHSIDLLRISVGLVFFGFGVLKFFPGVSPAENGIMSPLVLFFTDLFPAGPTLEAQYVLKDIVLVTAGLVIAVRALGTRFVSDEAPVH